MTSDEKLLISQPTAEEKETKEAKETKETKEERPEVEGILEIQEENNFGFLRFSNFLTSDKDIYVSPAQIRRFNLKTGDKIRGITRLPKEGERFGALLYVLTVNGDEPGTAIRRPDFDDLTPVFPYERLRLESGSRELSMRLIDLVAPIGKGQRGLIVAPPKAGKTVLLKSIAGAIERSYPEIELIVLLVDERPEEVTDMKRSLKTGDVIYSTFDELPEKLTYPAITPTLFERKKQGIGKRLLYGTGNPAKLSLMRKNLEQLQIEIVGLSDIDVAVPQADEDGDSPLENARKKAKCYYEAFQIPVFSCDTGLYFENVPEDKQPGVHVRRVNGKNLSDAEMLAYYSGLAAEYGGLHAYYRNAICLIMDEEHIYESMDETFSSEPFLITSVPHPDGIRREGFPLDCLSVDLTTGKYYYDLDPAELGKVAAEDGSRRFFEKITGIFPHNML